jgi:hypothetical protein
MGVICSIPSGTRINQPEQAGQQDVAELFKLSTTRSGKGQIPKLPHRTTYCDLTFPEMVDDAEPVLMVDGREVPVEELRVDQKRTAGNEWFLPAPGQAPRMSHDRRIRVLLDLEPYDRVFV